jgi:hypothetical protein
MARTILLTLLFLAASVSTRAVAIPPLPVEGVKEGWKQEANDGSISYILQVTPQKLSEIALAGAELKLIIPDHLQGVARNVILRVGSAEVERDPSEAEIRALMQNSLPHGNRIGGGSLTTLSDSISGAVNIDPMRVTPSTIPTAGTSSLGDTPPSITVPPPNMLAQSFSNGSSRSNFNTTFPDPTRTASNNGIGGFTNSGTGAPVMPRNDTSLYNNNFVGPTLPPGYTGGNTTVSSTAAPSGVNTGYNQWNTPSSYGNSSSTSLANGNFGNANNYPNGSYNNVPSLGYSTPSNNSSPGVSNSGMTGFNTNSYPVSTNSYGAVNGYNNTPGLNGVYSPNTHMASNAPSGSSPNYSSNPNMMNGFGTAGINNNSMMPPVVPPMSNVVSYPPGQSMNLPNNNFPSNGNGALGTGYPVNTYLNSNGAGIGAGSSLNTNMRTPRTEFEYPREYGQSSPLNFMFVLFLLFSAVANVYLLMQLNLLLQRYRSLQAASRGTNSFAV